MVTSRPRSAASGHACVAVAPALAVTDRQRQLVCQVAAHPTCPRYVRGEAAVRVSLAPGIGRRSRIAPAGHRHRGRAPGGGRCGRGHERPGRRRWRWHADAGAGDGIRRPRAPPWIGLPGLHQDGGQRRRHRRRRLRPRADPARPSRRRRPSGRPSSPPVTCPSPGAASRPARHRTRATSTWSSAVTPSAPSLPDSRPRRSSSASSTRRSTIRTPSASGARSGSRPRRPETAPSAEAAVRGRLTVRIDGSDASAWGSTGRPGGLRARGARPAIGFDPVRNRT